MSETPQVERGVVPHLLIRDGRGIEAIAFYVKAFGATEVFKQMAEDGKRFMHAHLEVNGGALLLHDDFPEFRDNAPAEPVGGTVLHLEVANADEWWKRALDAGAEVKFEIADQFWGARYGQVSDPFGHTWSLGSPLG